VSWRDVLVGTGRGRGWRGIVSLLVLLFGFLIILNNGDQYECRMCNAVVFRGDRIVLVVVPRGEGPVVAAGAFPIADVKAVMELRDEV
jgi:hypothetical protein